MALKNQDVLQADVIQGDASFFRQQYFLLVDRRFTLDQVLNPEWWRLQTKLRVHDEITLLAEDGSFDILARVVQADRGGYCVLRIFREWYQDTAVAKSEGTGEARVVLIPQTGWNVVSASGVPLARFATEDSANAALAELAQLPDPATAPAPDSRARASGVHRVMRESIVIEPSGESCDFVRKTYDTSRVWFRNPRPLWVANLLPDAIKAACSGSDFTFSPWRTFGLIDPAHFTVPREFNACIKVFMPVGGTFDATLWCSLDWFSASRQPIASTSHFHITGGGLSRILTDALMQPEFHDQLRKTASRPRVEYWTRWDWRALEIAPGCIEKPGYMRAVENLPPEEQAQRMNAWRLPTSSAEYFNIRRIEREQRDRDAASEPEAPVQPEEAAPPTPPTVLTTEQRRELKRTRERLSKTAKGAQAAQRFNETAAKAHSAKVISKLTRAGQF